MKEKYRHPEPSTKGLVAQYKLWAGLTSTANVFDYAQNGYTGTVTGTDIAPTYPGLSFNGTDDFVDITASGPSAVSTTAAWIKLDNLTGFKNIVNLNITDSIYANGSALFTTVFAGGVAVKYVNGIVGTALTTDWCFVAVTDTVAKDADALTIGKVTGVLFKGLIGEVMLYDRVLSQAEVSSLYELTKWRYPNN